MIGLQEIRVETRSGLGAWCLPAICFAAGLAGLSVAITSPILVDIAHTLGATVALTGQLMTVASLAGMGGTFGLSPMLDRIGRRQAITITLAVMALASLVCAAAPSFLLLCIAYGLVGLGGYTLLALCLAAMGDLYQGKELGKRMGWLVFGNMGLGVVALPIVSTLAAYVGWRYGFVFYAGLALCATAVVRMAVPGDLCPARSERVGYVGALRRVFGNRVVLALLVTVAFYHSSVYGFATYVGATAIQRLGATTAQTGPIISLCRLGCVLAGLGVGRMFRATDWRLTAAACLVCAASTIGAYALAGGLVVFTILAMIQGATTGVMDVALNSLVVSVESSGRGSVTALRSVMDSLGGVVGPAMGGAVVAASGYPATGWLFGLLAVGAAIATYGSAVAGRGR